MRFLAFTLRSSCVLPACFLRYPCVTTQGQRRDNAAKPPENGQKTARKLLPGPPGGPAALALQG